MNCKQCGSFIPDGMPSCPTCGTPVIRNNPLALVGMILGIVALVLCWIPYLGFLIAVAGLVLSIIGVTKKNTNGKGKAIAGIICAGIALLVASLMTSAVSKSANKSNDTKPSSNAVVATTQAETSEIETTFSETTEVVEPASDNSTTTTTEETTIVTEATINIDEFIESCSEINYKDIARNPDDYVGQNFYAVVYIGSARQGGLFTGYQKYYISYVFDTEQADEYIDYGWYDSYSDAGFGAADTDKSIWLLDNRNESDPNYVKILETDVITVYGTFTGMQETKNTLTGETGEQVALDIKYVEILD